jgi:RES domain-containing protein
MRAFRLCRSTYLPYDAEGARRVGGRWNSKGIRVLYMSENRSLAVLEVLVHLSSALPDKYLLGSADIPDSIPIERIADEYLPRGWDDINPGRAGFHEASWRYMGCTPTISYLVRPVRDCWRTELRPEPRSS